MSAETSTTALHTSLEKLDLSKPKAKTKKAEPADSWEDEAGSDTETEEAAPAPASLDDSSPGPPPPTPSSPAESSWHAFDQSPFRGFQSYGTGGPPGSPPRSPPAGASDRRPEKSTAVASRLIAAGIGQKAPKRTKEQREFDAAAKLQEQKKRELAKAEEERKRVEKEKALRDIWDG